MTGKKSSQFFIKDSFKPNNNGGIYAAIIISVICNIYAYIRPTTICLLKIRFCILVGLFHLIHGVIEALPCFRPGIHALGFEI